MVSKYDDSKDLVPCAFVHIKYGYDGMSEEQAHTLAHYIQQALRANTNIELVDFHLEGFDYMNTPKPDDMED